MSRLALIPATALALLALLAAPARAIPAGGASADTPGTSATVSPATLPVGGTLRFTVTGFPAGEVVYVKIDDGETCSASAVHGACVVHQQRLDGRGAASGTIVLPSDVGTGRHWLRFLASQQVEGAGGGVKGYTARGHSDFTVTAASAASTAGTPSRTPAATATASAAAGITPAAVPTAGAGAPTAGATLHVDLPKPVATVTVTARAEASAISTSAAAPGAERATSRPPYVGIGGLVLLLGLAGVLVARRITAGRA